VFYVSGHYGGLNAEFVFVTDVAVTLTVQTQLQDPQTHQFQTKPKRCERIARNVSTLTCCPADETNRVQVSPEHEKQFVVSVKNGKEEMAMKRNNEKGTAMLFAIILVLVLRSWRLR